MPRRQLWFVSFKSRHHDEPGHWQRFDHWEFFLPRAAVHRKEDLAKGTVIHVGGSPFTGYSLLIEKKDISGTNSEYDAKLLMPEVDLEQIKRVAKDLGGLARSDNPGSGEPNCQNWLHMLAGCLEEEDIIGKHVRRFLNAVKQR
ncbi:hypothetical protein H072_11043 [Dactylellina haptotyla CBS 200.50]|uniref:Uncharacterized protein n=1 Tax=Dactylellina haptotyla (strain CBS 200.50) TaxID=1284197 RepID=S7ZYH8_DACHA|nr:hypothetical protein H072_11043 [Dactylellina haptotyla CBS 200.50]